MLPIPVGSTNHNVDTDRLSLKYFLIYAGGNLALFVLPPGSTVVTMWILSTG